MSNSRKDTKHGLRRVYLKMLKLPKTQPISLFMYHFFDEFRTSLDDITLHQFVSELANIIKSLQPSKISIEGWYEVKDLLSKKAMKDEDIVNKIKIILTLPVPQTSHIDFKLNDLSPEWEVKFTNLIMEADAELEKGFQPKPIHVPESVQPSPSLELVRKIKMEQAFRMFEKLISTPGNDLNVISVWSGNPDLPTVIRQLDRLNAVRIFLLMYKNIEDLGFFQKYVSALPYNLILDFIHLINNSTSIPVINPIAKALKLNVLHAVKIQKAKQMQMETPLEISQPERDAGSKRPRIEQSLKHVEDPLKKSKKDVERPLKKLRTDKVPPDFFDEPLKQEQTATPITTSTSLPTPVAVTPVTGDPNREIYIEQMPASTPFLSQEDFYDPSLNLFAPFDSHRYVFGDDLDEKRYDYRPDSHKY